MKNTAITHWSLRLFIAALLSSSAAVAQSTQEMLEELERLQQQVQSQRAQVQRQVEERKRTLQQEQRLLQQVLGNEQGGDRADAMSNMMTRQELEAELRILRDEIEVLRRQVSQRRDGDGEEKLRMNLQVRSRLEWKDTDFSSGRADLRHLLRSRWSVDATPRANTRIFAQIQDARLWGEEASTLEGSADQIDFHQAYFALSALFDRPLEIRVGRQELSYGSQRLVGAVDWHNVGRAFDAIHLRYGTDSWVDVFNAKLAEKGEKDRNFYGLYGHYQAEGHAWEPYLFFGHDKNDPVDRLKRITLGLHGAGKVVGATGHAFSFEVESAFQTGEIGPQDVAAFMVTGSGKYTSNHWRQHTVALGIDFLSGDSAPTDGDYKAFDTLFATNHKFYGFMDYFVNIPVDTNQRGLLDIALKTGIKLSPQAKMDLHLHNFSLAVGGEKALGQEIDAVLNYAHNPAAQIQWGASFFLPGDAMEAMRGSGDPAFKVYWQNAVSF